MAGALMRSFVILRHFPLLSSPSSSFLHTSFPSFHPDNDGSKGHKGSKVKTPVGKLEESSPEAEVRHPYQEKEPLKRHPGGVNPDTGEIGGPAGPEPTRYGDWERKGRVSDF